MKRLLRVSFIEFLNALPLGWGLMRGAESELFELIFDVPSECARHLASGEVDIGLIPVIEYLRIDGLKIIPEISIASRREVQSVIFVSRPPLEKVKTIALDSSSRTSAMLLQILFRRFYERDDVSFFEAPPDPEGMLERFDAALLIGNSALQVCREGLFVYDLAHEWNRFTGLPFVFAFWAVRPDVKLTFQERQAFYDSRDQGLAAIDDIARLYADRVGLTEGKVKDYLRNNLDFSLDEANVRGLQRFFELASELELVDRQAPLNFV